MYFSDDDALSITKMNMHARCCVCPMYGSGSGMSCVEEWRERRWPKKD